MWIFLFMNIRRLFVLANMQLKTADISLIFGMCRFAFRNGSFCTLKRPVSGDETCRFASRNGAFCKLLNIR